MPIQFLIVAFAVFAVSRAWQAFAAGSLDRRKLLLWGCFWVLVVTAILLPQTTSVLAIYLGVGRGVDLVLYLSVVGLFYGLFTMSRKVDRLERNLTQMVRRLALRDTDSHDHDG